MTAGYRMFKLAAALYALNAIPSLAMGVRYFRRTDFMPYQAKAVGHGVAEFSPELRTVILAMLKVIGGGFLGFGVTSLGLCAALWQGSATANWALAIGSAALFGPAWLAASRVDGLGPDMRAPVRLVEAGAATSALAFVLALFG